MGIGAGKSTVIEAVKHLKGEIKVAEEPVRIWTELKGNIFEKYLADQRKYAALFQVLATYTCFKNTRILQKEGVNVIVERGGEASYRIFTKANVEEGFIDEAEMGVLEFLLKSWEEDGILAGRTDAHIFIRVSKETAKVRMGLRNREGYYEPTRWPGTLAGYGGRAQIQHILPRV